jgi:hypothetical protein
MKNKSTGHGCSTLDFFISDIKLQAIYKVIHTSNLSTDYSIGHILLWLYALFKCWTCSDPCWICKKIFATRCLAYDQPNELFFYINIFTLISYSPKPLLSSRDVNRIPTKLKLLTGTYILQNNRAKYKNYTIDPTCLLCDSEAETPAHFILNCPAMFAWYCFSMSFIFVLFMLYLLTVWALYVCLCDYVNICMYLVLLCIFGKKLPSACVYCYTKTNINIIA